MTTATATRPRTRDALPLPGASPARRTSRAGVRGGDPWTDRGPHRAAPASGRAACGRGTATPRRLERDRRRLALALLVAVAVLGTLTGRGAGDAGAAVLDLTGDRPGGAHAGEAPRMPDGPGASVAGQPPDAAAPAAAPASRPEYLVVAEGDTLWDLVAPHAPAGVDPSVYVARVAAEGDLDPRALVPGTVVRLP